MLRERGKDETIRELQRRADHIADLIISCDYPAVDVAIEIRKLRDWADRNFEDSDDLFQMIYQSRFKRLWDQFRPDDSDLLPQW